MNSNNIIWAPDIFFNRKSGENNLHTIRMNLGVHTEITQILFQALRYNVIPVFIRKTKTVEMHYHIYTFPIYNYTEKIDHVFPSIRDVLEYIASSPTFGELYRRNENTKSFPYFTFKDKLVTLTNNIYTWASQVVPKCFDVVDSKLEKFTLKPLSGRLIIEEYNE